MREEVPKMMSDVWKGSQNAWTSRQKHEKVARMCEQVSKMTSDVWTSWQNAWASSEKHEKVKECGNTYPKSLQMCEKTANKRDEVTKIMKQ